MPLHAALARRIGAALLVAATAASMLPGAAAAVAPSEICASRLTLSRSSTTARLVMPYCTNRSLTVRNVGVRRLVIVIHGDSRNAMDHERYLLQAAAAAGVSDELVVAPQFLSIGDLAGAGLPTNTAYWDDGWKDGQPSATSPSRPWTISSFGIVDLLIRIAANRAVFPNLREVVVVGHSAGGQFTQRYAAETPIGTELAAAGTSLRFVVANPSSYLYMTSWRYHRTRLAFAALTPAELDACPRFNWYKHGLDRLNAYGAASGASLIRTRYAGRTVTYLLGALDTDATDSTMDGSCAGTWQGPNRLARGQRFVQALILQYGSAVTLRHRLSIVPGVAHDAKGMYLSAVGRSVLFP